MGELDYTKSEVYIAYYSYMNKSVYLMFKFTCNITSLSAKDILEIILVVLNSYLVISLLLEYNTERIRTTLMDFTLLTPTGVGPFSHYSSGCLPYVYAQPYLHADSVMSGTL